jgi:catechol 2,3-dioxygenase-like lactoylglutathione lyase family enzyme
MIRGIHHTAISTGDLERALGFYRDLLGFEVVLEFAWPKGTGPADQITGLDGSAAKVAMLKTANTFIELFEYDAPSPAPGDPERPVCDHGITHIALDVRDIQAEYERLSAAGMRFHCPPLDMGGSKATYGRDPDGNVVELLEIAGEDNPTALELK